jgi:hypothetical protein
MGKTELRAACKAAGIKNYSKMDNAAMRAALEALEGDVHPVQKQTEEERAAERAAYVEMGKKMDLTQLDYHGVEDHCPHCGIHVSNGLSSYQDILDQGTEHDKQVAGKMKNEIVCLGCGGEWGAPIVRGKQVDRHTGTGLQIEKNREMKNGIKRPSAGGKCREIWDYLDEVYEGGKGPMPTSSMVKEAAAECGWNPNNASIEFYQWRKFNGIAGRQK